MDGGDGRGQEERKIAKALTTRLWEAHKPKARRAPVAAPAAPFAVKGRIGREESGKPQGLRPRPMATRTTRDDDDVEPPVCLVGGRLSVASGDV